MAAAIPLAITAAGGIASKLGSNKQKNQQNQFNQEADQKYNDINQGYADKMSGIGDEQRNQNQGILDSIMGGAGSLWSQAGQGGPSYTPKMSDSQGFYKNAMNTGLYDEGQKNDFRARGAIQNDKLFDSFKRDLSQNANIRGGNYAGYSGQNRLLARDTARQAEESRLNSEGTLQDQIRQNMFGGAEGVSSNDANFAQQGLASAQLEGQNLDRQFGQQSSLLGLLQNLRTQGTNDQGYYNQAGGAYQNYRSTPETAQQPWYGAVGDAAQGIGTGLMTNGQGQNNSQRGVTQMPQLNQNQARRYGFNQLS